VGDRDREAHPAGQVLAVRGDEVDPPLGADPGQDLLDGQAAGLPDDVADEQDATGARRPRRGSVGRVAEDRPADLAGYFAYSTARVSRMTVTLIWPG
jgi:hypothetical protein